jgi:hypothetical protein
MKMGNRPDDDGDTQIPSTVEEERALGSRMEDNIPDGAQLYWSHCCSLLSRIFCSHFSPSYVVVEL